MTTLASDKRDTYSVMIHSVPSTLSSGELKDFLTSISSVARHLYVTTNHVDYYESFADDWATFVSEVPA